MAGSKSCEISFWEKHSYSWYTPHEPPGSETPITVSKDMTSTWIAVSDKAVVNQTLKTQDQTEIIQNWAKPSSQYQLGQKANSTFYGKTWPRAIIDGYYWTTNEWRYAIAMPSIMQSMGGPGMVEVSFQAFIGSDQDFGSKATEWQVTVDVASVLKNSILTVAVAYDVNNYVKLILCKIVGYLLPPNMLGSFHLKVSAPKMEHQADVWNLNTHGTISVQRLEIGMSYQPNWTPKSLRADNETTDGFIIVG